MKTSSQCRSCRRGRIVAGFTLLEMVVTLSVLLVLAVSAASILGSVTEIGMDRRHHATERAEVMRFAEDLRRDTEASDDVAVVDDGQSVRLSSENRLTEYRWDSSRHQWMRLVSLAGEQNELRAEDVLESDLYVLSPRCEPQVSYADDLVRVVLRRSDGSSPAWVVEASQ